MKHKKTDMGDELSKREAAFLRAKQKMREEMDQAWIDFFEKNPDIEEKDVRRRVVSRLKRKQN